MGAIRVVMAMLCLLVLGKPAHAQAVDLVVFGPISDGDVKLHAEAMSKIRIGTASPKKLDLACVAKTDCLVTAGAEASARRALAVSVAGEKISFVLVDVVDKELISKRDVNIVPNRKLAKELDKELRKFVADGPTDRAKALFAIGNKHYELGEYPQALELYKKAYRVKALPAFQFNIAQCHRKLGQHKEAIALYQAYLVAIPKADNRALVESLITESKNQIAAAEKAVRDAEQAKLDTEKKKAEEARLAAQAQQAEKEAVVNAEVERRKQLQAKLDAERQRELDKTYNKHPARRWMIATGIVGLAVAGGGAYFGLSARKHQTAFDDAGCGDPTESLPQATLDKCRDDKDTGAQHARLANILIGAGGAVVLGSLIVYIIDPGNIERPKERATLAVTPTSVGVVVRW